MSQKLGSLKCKLFHANVIQITSPVGGSPGRPLLISFRSSFALRRSQAPGQPRPLPPSASRVLPVAQNPQLRGWKGTGRLAPFSPGRTLCVRGSPWGARGHVCRHFGHASVGEVLLASRGGGRGGSAVSSSARTPHTEDVLAPNVHRAAWRNPDLY